MHRLSYPDEDFAHFRAWAETAGHSFEVPIQPESLAAFLSDLVSSGKTYSTIEKRCYGVSAFNVRGGGSKLSADPLVRSAMTGAKLKHHRLTKKRRDALLPRGVSVIVATLRAKASLAAYRDIALITLQRGSGAKPGPISAMNRSDIELLPGAMKARVRTAGKVPTIVTILPDPEIAVCSIRAMNEYLAKVDPVPGDMPLFRGVTRWDAFRGETRLDPVSITRIIKRAAREGGLESQLISGQSIRLGRIAETIAYQGKNRRAIASVVGYAHTGHLKRFIAEATNMQDDLLAKERF